MPCPVTPNGAQPEANSQKPEALHPRKRKNHMNNEVQTTEEVIDKEMKDRISRLTPAQREMLQRRLRGQSSPGQSKSVIQRRSGSDYPVTAEQEHLWVLHRVERDVFYFNHTHAYLLEGEFSAAAMERTLDEMLRR